MRLCKVSFSYLNKGSLRGGFSEVPKRSYDLRPLASRVALAAFLYLEQNKTFQNDTAPNSLYDFGCLEPEVYFGIRSARYKTPLGFKTRKTSLKKSFAFL